MRILGIDPVEHEKAKTLAAIYALGLEPRSGEDVKTYRRRLAAWFRKKANREKVRDVFKRMDTA